MYNERIKLYKELEKLYNSKVLVYVTSDRQGAAGQIADDVIDYFINHLEIMGHQNKITLYIYTRGGITSSAWTIINLIRMYCDELHIVVPYKCHSAGTLICLGGNKITMTKYATLGPIDPSFMVPSEGEGQNRSSVENISVEEVVGYIKFVRDVCSIKKEENLVQPLMRLSNTIKPQSLGKVYRANKQVPMLARTLLSHQVESKKKREEIISFLCSDSGSHDYTINYEDAKRIGLKVELATEEENKIIKKIYNDIRDEILLNVPFNPNALVGFFKTTSALLESIDGGSDVCTNEGQIMPTQQPNMPPFVMITFQGWKHGNEAINPHKIGNKKEEAHYEKLSNKPR